MPNPLVLIADDDVGLCDLLGSYLRTSSLEVETVHTAHGALARLAIPPLPDILVLDVMLPDMDGLSALKRIRGQHDLPVLMLSARGEPVDRVVGLELGADDYLAKPCLPRELLARINALLRRRNEKPSGGDELTAGSLRLKPAERRAWVGGLELELTGAEFEILHVLTRESGRLVSRQELTERGLRRPLENFDRSVDVHVSRLRHKLAAAPDAPHIEGVRGAGYILSTAVHE